MMTKQKKDELLEDEIKTDMRAGKLELKKKPGRKDKVYFFTNNTAGLKDIWLNGKKK